jgi:hypothetical protein
MEALYYIFRYLKHHDRSMMVFDHSYLNWNDGDFPTYDWNEFHPNVAEEPPPNAPPARGNPVQLNIFVDASHANNKLNCRSHTGILFYINRSPIIWYSKPQKTV